MLKIFTLAILILISLNFGNGLLCHFGVDVQEPPNIALNLSSICLTVLQCYIYRTKEGTYHESNKVFEKIEQFLDIDKDIEIVAYYGIGSKCYTHRESRCRIVRGILGFFDFKHVIYGKNFSTCYDRDYCNDEKISLPADCQNITKDEKIKIIKEAIQATQNISAETASTTAKTLTTSTPNTKNDTAVEGKIDSRSNVPGKGSSDRLKYPGFAIWCISYAFQVLLQKNMMEQKRRP